MLKIILPESLKNKNTLGGAIISPYHIITAAHGFLRFDVDHPGPCLVTSYKNESEVLIKKVAFGDDCIRSAVTRLSSKNLCGISKIQTAKIRMVAIDHGFAMGLCQEGHDWAIIELEEPIEFDNYTSPICLPFPGQPVQPVVTAISWGRTSIYYESDPLIREIPMQSDPSCSAPWSDQMPTKVMDYLCAKSLDPGNWNSKRTCHGDSGSGLQQVDSHGLYTLVGVTSFGSVGCPPNELARFTRISNYLEDICELTGVCYTV
uniref:Peptidase S1 domain-containing protein n=1 Tax=Bursaphelenchus xylophilus TaxID=6326 RepID=A0A1I7RT28_BURXY